VRRIVAGLVLPLLLLTAACGGGDDSSDDEGTDQPREGTPADVTVTGEPGEKPKVEFKAPMSFAKTEGTIVDEGPGTGDAVTADSNISIHYLGINASNAEEFDTNYGDKPATFVLNQAITGLQIGLEGSHAGDRVLVTINSKDGFDPTGSQDGSIREGDSVIFVVDVVKVVTPQPIPLAQVPTLKLEDGKPVGFTPKPTTPDTVSGLTVQVLKEGDGPEVQAGQTLTVNYLGQVYPDGTVFDESYSKKPATFSLDGVIPGWTQGLEGQKVGSRVVLVIPSELGYGAAGQGEDIPPNADLIFVVDIQKAE